MQSLILAGGLGTRLRSEVPDRPKVLAPIGRRPFLFYGLDHLRKYGVRDVILAVGYLAERVEEVFGDGSGLGMRIRYAREESPLGTGGALRNALPLVEDEDLLVLNGDSFFDLDPRTLDRFHRLWGAGATMALKLRADRGRYGVVDLTPSQALTLTSSSSPNDIGRGGRYDVVRDVKAKNLYQVAGFREKDAAGVGDGYINGGVYTIRRELLQEIPEGICSLEKDLLPGWVSRGEVRGIPFGGRFIDIGVPEDYRRACEDLDGWVKMPKSGALFLDRDGVLNEDLGYVYRKEQIRLIPRGIERIREAKRDGRRVVVLTNQAGVARGYYTERDVRVLHAWLLGELARRGAVIDGFYHCPHHPEGSVEAYRRECLCRKPQPGLALRAAEELGIVIEESRMIGDKESDRIRLPYLETEIWDDR